MRALLTTLDRLDYLTVVWLLPVVFLLHEAEEWNILAWYRRNYVDLPPKTNRTIRTFLVFASVVGFVWVGIASILGDPRVAAFVVLLAATTVVLNALQHVYWLVRFREYAPGVVTSVLLISLICYLAARAVQEEYVPLWYVVGLAVLGVVPGLVQTVKAGNRLTPQFRAIHNFAAKLSKWLWKSDISHD